MNDIPETFSMWINRARLSVKNMKDTRGPDVDKKMFHNKLF